MKHMLGLFFIAVSLNAFADTRAGEGKVTEIWSGYQNGMVLFKLNITHINPKECAANAFYAVDPNKADSDKFLSLLLMAKASGANVDVVLSDTECFSNYPVALRIGIKS